MHGANSDFTRIFIGKIEKEKLLNIVREIKQLWIYSENIWPNGDRKQRPQLKATCDKHGQYSIWLNAQGLTYLATRFQDTPALKLGGDDPINLDDIPF